MPLQEKITYLPEQVKYILETIAEVVEIPGIANAFASDKSCIDHFFILTDDPEAKLEILSDRLGIKVEFDDLIWEVAIRLKNQ